MKQKAFSFISVIAFMLVMLGGSAVFTSQAEGDNDYKCTIVHPNGSFSCLGSCGVCAPVVIIPGDDPE